MRDENNMKKVFSVVLVLLFVAVGIFAQGYNPNSVFPPYDIGKCANMLGRALAAKFDLAQNGQDYSDVSVQKAILLTRLTKKQAEVTVKYCPKLMNFWYSEKLWNDKARLTPDMFYRLMLNVDTNSTMIYGDMINDLYNN